MPPNLHEQQLTAIKRLLDDPDRVLAELNSLLPCGKEGFHEPDVIRYWIQAKTGIKESKMDCFEKMFHRFDHDGDGCLSVQEALSMVTFALRAARDRLSPCTAGKITFEIPSRSLTEHFEMQGCAGEGGQGAAYFAVHKASGCRRLVKMYSKEDANAPLEDIKMEFAILRRLDHPCIAHVHDIFQDNANVYVISEPYFGGDLRHLLRTARKKLGPERVTFAWLGFIVRDVLCGLGYLHAHKIVHCDIKESNVMVAKDFDWECPEVVIIDFGLARDFTARDINGTPGYMPPEVWRSGLWTAKGDIFSLAVTLWALLNGTPGGPFYAKDSPPFHVISSRTAELPMDVTNLEDLALGNLLSGMAAKAFRDRPSARECLGHRFFTTIDAPASAPLCSEALKGLSTNPRRLTAQNIIAMELLQSENLAQLSELNRLFRRMDRNGDGEVEHCEAIEEFQRAGMDDRRAKLLADALLSEDGNVSYSEFMAKLMYNQKAFQGAALSDVFSALDLDGSGFLDVQEVEALISKPNLTHVVHGRSAAEIVEEMDINGDGHISFREFQRIMLGADRPTTGWHFGDLLQYHSSRGWRYCSVTAVDHETGSVQVNLKPGVWITPAEQETCLRPGPTSPTKQVKDLLVWAVGDNAAFYSRTYRTWRICKITAMQDSTGCVMLDLKPGCWIGRKEQQRLLRQMVLPGDQCECLTKDGRWIPCVPTRVNRRGSIELDVKPGHWISLGKACHVVRRVE